MRWKRHSTVHFQDDVKQIPHSSIRRSSSVFDSLSNSLCVNYFVTESRKSKNNNNSLASKVKIFERVNQVQEGKKERKKETMAVVESASQDSAVSSAGSIPASNGQDHPKQNGGTMVMPLDQGLYNQNNQRSNGGGDFKRDMRELQELFSKLNPMAEEFVPPSLAKTNNNNHGVNGFNGGFFANNSLIFNNHNARNGNVNVNAAVRRKKSFGQGKRRMNSRTSLAQREEIIRRTVYVSDIDQQVTEEQLAALFVGCGQVVDCRICGDPNSVLRFAFIEFTDEEGARAALNLAGTMLGFYPVRVLPSKTAIAPVNPTFLPRTEDEREMCARTIYCTNIDKKVTQADVKLFFESVCGEVYRLRLLGDYHHSTRIAFVEFVMAESAIAALNCSGVVLGSLPIRVSPSKTPVRPRAPRLPMH
ncbi:polyadenylate-binding protein-interacting protein 11 [Citrus sinensis]|uniref:Polyadenylate-binding protein-interacting protein 11 n=1 Tax=Citrus sinensis TaxID=2711 RepID=A0ACB8LNC9_CITSI|nr:polyadenylate-binding protein-interacting protein 11 [Citrus sinensis]